MTTTKPHGYWQRNAQLLRDQAKTMTCKELAKAHHATPKQIRHQLYLLQISCKSAKLARYEHLSELCKKQLSVRQIAELEGKTTSAIYQELKLHGLSTINAQLRWTEAAIAELTEQAKTRTAAELAALRQFDLKYMYKLLRRFGIKTRPHRTVVPRPQSPRRHPSSAPLPHTRPCCASQRSRPMHCHSPSPSQKSSGPPTYRSSALPPAFQTTRPCAPAHHASRWCWAKTSATAHGPSNAPIHASTMRTPCSSGEKLAGNPSL